MQKEKVTATNLKELASQVGVNSETLVEMLEDFPDLYFWKRRKRHPRCTKIIPADIEKIKILLPSAVLA